MLIIRIVIAELLMNV